MESPNARTKLCTKTGALFTGGELTVKKDWMIILSGIAYHSASIHYLLELKFTINSNISM